MEYKLAKNVMVTTFGDVTYLLNCDTNMSIQLTGVANDIINLLNQKQRSFENLASTIKKKYEIDESRLKSDLEKLLNNLIEINFLVGV